jgi:hypothetical protein
MGRRGRQLAEKHDDPARQAVISEWDRWASRRLPTGYKATSEDEMRFLRSYAKGLPAPLAGRHGRPLAGRAWMAAIGAAGQRSSGGNWNNAATQAVFHWTACHNSELNYAGCQS